MKDLPTIHPRKGSSSKYSIWAKNLLFGATTFDESSLNTVYPAYLTDMQGNQVERENVFSTSYEFERTYFVKVITPRHLKAHRMFTWWRNKIFSTNRVGKPFTSFDTPLEMAEYEYKAASQIAGTTNAIPTPHEYTVLNSDSETGTATILYDFVSNAGKIDDDSKTLKGFDHILKSLRELHNNGFVHTTVPNHVIETIPTGEPYLTDPVGAVKPTEKAALHVIGFDIVTLLSVYTPVIGTVPALNAITDYYSELELIAAHRTAPTVQYCVPGTQPWVVQQIKSSIDEFVTADTIEEYEHVMAETQTMSIEEDTVETNQSDGSSPSNTSSPETLNSKPLPVFLKEFVNTINERESNSPTQAQDIERDSQTTPTKMDDTPLRITKRKTDSPTRPNNTENISGLDENELETPRELSENPEETIEENTSGNVISRLFSRKKDSPDTSKNDADEETRQ